MSVYSDDSCRDARISRNHASRALVRLGFAAIAGLVCGATADAQRLFEHWSKHSFPWRVATTAQIEARDADGDNDLDLLFSYPVFGSANVYFNDGRGAYVEALLRPPPGISSKEAVFVDVDGDKDLDVVAGTSHGVILTRNRLYLHDGKGTFKDVTATHMPGRKSRSWSVAAGDIDRDGDPDLVFGGLGVQNLLYLNDGKGRFTDVTASRMPADTKATVSVALADVDGDGWLDILAGNAGAAETNDVYVSQRGQGFSMRRLSGSTDTTKRLLAADVDLDRDVDVLVINQGFGKAHELYLNDGKGGFTDNSHLLVGPDRKLTVEGAAFGDFDGDGNLDLFVGGQAAQGSPIRLHLNQGKTGFTDVTARALPTGLRLGRVSGVAAADLDGDGDLDIVFSQSGLLLPVSGHQLWNKAQVGKPFTLDLFADQGHGVLPAIGAARASSPSGWIRWGPSGWTPQRPSCCPWSRSAPAARRP